MIPKTNFGNILLIPFGILFLLVLSCSEKDRHIDRYALVTRHNVHLSDVDTLGSLSVGNGEFAFTVDVSGLQTFYEDYENGIALGTQTQWAWHSTPSKEKYTLDEIAQHYETCDGRQVPYAVQRNDGKARDATNWLRANPHRLHLGLIGLVLLKDNGDSVQLRDMKNIDQTLNLWSGNITSRYEIEGKPVTVELYGHQAMDAIAARITSPLMANGQLKVFFKFPYGDDCHVCSGLNFEQPHRHQTSIISQSEHALSLERTLDSTQYYVDINSTAGSYRNTSLHEFELDPGEVSSFEFSIHFKKKNDTSSVNSFQVCADNSRTSWEEFWTNGGAIDFSDCTDPRAVELERRIILSQYLTKIQCAGSMPPQETGLTMNSWYGKFHLEMDWWHGVHFALWNRPELLEKRMDWYFQVLGKATATARWQGYKGARWQKMTDPHGNESPSSVGAFILWQQPHPIYFAELLYRHDPKTALEKYRTLVFETAEFMASFAQLSDNDELYHLCSPLIPAQEIFRATETSDPPFELAYWHYALSVAQQWRVRSGLDPDKDWQDVIDRLAPLEVHDDLYLPARGVSDAYVDDQYRRDHPVVVGAYGVLPNSDRIDPAIMTNTFDAIMSKWDWQSTWGWDYPMLAMTAARIGKPDKAIEALLLDVQKNTYLVNGHNYQDNRLRLYLPGNGGLLAAISMMAAGWDGSTGNNPGFPDDGKWNVRWEGLKPMP